MSEFDKWRQKIREESSSNEEDIKAYMNSKVSSSVPFRLEVLKDTNSELILIQGNLVGLDFLKGILERLVNTKTIGGHVHLEASHGLTKADVAVIVQLVGDNENDDGPHKIS